MKTIQINAWATAAAISIVTIAAPALFGFFNVIAQYGTTNGFPIVSTGPIFNANPTTTSGGGGGGGGGGRRSLGYYSGGSFIPGVRQIPTSGLPSQAYASNTPVAIGKLMLNYDFDEACLDRQFSDTDANHIHLNATQNLFCHEIIHGRGDDGDTMYLDTPIIRAEYMKVVARAVEAQMYEWSLGSAFPDNGKEHWFSTYVDTMEIMEVIQGYPDGMFHPGREINFGEVLKVVSLAFGVNVNTADAMVWQAPYYEALNMLGVIPVEIMDADYGYIPTRGETFQLVDNMLKLMNSNYRGQ